MITINFTVRGEPQSFDVAVGQPLKPLADEVTANILAHCPELTGDAQFHCTLADRLLEGLACEYPAVNLGEVFSTQNGDIDLPIPDDLDSLWDDPPAPQE